MRCGAVLAGEGRPQEKRGFAAAPDENRFLPYLSTIFPHLPRASLRTFRLALLAGTVVVVALALGRLFPVALVAAAVLVPLLTVLYLYDVDLYEDEPVRVIALTMIWGAIAGIATTLVINEFAPSGFDIVLGDSSDTTLWRGIVQPLASTVFMVAGPLVLLPYRRFNDILDGATFGAASAVAFIGASVITNSFDLFDEGFRPVGRIWPWVARLLELGIAMPLLAAGAIGAVAGAFWLRYRAPVRDRAALGILSSPFVALPVAAAFLILAALAEIHLETTLALIVIFALAVGAMVWLRHVIHLGLLQEAAEIEIGPPITCANCGNETPKHTFCSTCGVSLAALPKERQDAPQPPREPQTAP